MDPYVMRTTSHAASSTARTACSTSTSNDAPPMFVSSNHFGCKPKYSHICTEYIGKNPAVAYPSTSAYVSPASANARSAACACTWCSDSSGKFG
jgi:hypothetical protein